MKITVSLILLIQGLGIFFLKNKFEFSDSIFWGHFQFVLLWLALYVAFPVGLLYSFFHVAPRGLSNKIPRKVGFALAAAAFAVMPVASLAHAHEFSFHSSFVDHFVIAGLALFSAVAVFVAVLMACIKILETN